MTRDPTASIEGGRKGGRVTAARWRHEPCPARHPEIGVVCGKEQKRLGHDYPPHRSHLWRGELGGVWTEVAWVQEVEL